MHVLKASGQYSCIFVCSRGQCSEHTPEGGCKLSQYKPELTTYVTKFPTIKCTHVNSHARLPVCSLARRLKLDKLV